MHDWSYYIKVSPNYSITYSKYTGLKSPTYNSGHFAKKKHNGTMSKKARSKLHNCMYWMLLISNSKKVYSKAENLTFHFKINFITLTLSSQQFSSDQYIKNHMLAPFLKFLKRSWNVQSYIWKAEAQTNGNIHFHITTNKFVHWRAIRMKWNSLQEKHGYLSKEQFNKPIKEINSTDVHAVRNEKHIIKYMLKYFSKSEPDKRPIDGKLWDASENLNQSAMVINETSGLYDPMISVLEDERMCDKKQNDFHSLYLYKRKLFNTLPISIREQFSHKIKSLRAADHPQIQVTIDTIY